MAGGHAQPSFPLQPLVEVATDSEVFLRAQVGAAADRLDGVGQSGLRLTSCRERAELLLPALAVHRPRGVVAAPPLPVALAAELGAAGAVLAAVLVAAAAPL